MRATVPLDSPLWAFSLAVYGSDGVADECLDLQERLNLDVNLLLFAAFMGAVEGVRLAAQDIAAANAVVADWHRDVVRALRRARRALKPPSLDNDGPLREPAASLRAQVKNDELQAEKIEQAMLWQWSRERLADRPRGDRALALAANVRAVLELHGMAADAADAAASRLRGAALAYPQS